jgi:hypothetical protein
MVMTITHHTSPSHDHIHGRHCFLKGRKCVVLQGDAYTTMVCAGNFEGAMQVWGVASNKEGQYYVDVVDTEAGA